MPCVPVMPFVSLRGYENTSKRHRKVYRQASEKFNGLSRMARSVGQRWLRLVFLDGKTSKSTSCFLVVLSWIFTRRHSCRPYLSQPGLCESATFEIGDASGKCFGEQRLSASDQCSENTLSRRTFVRQNLYFQTRRCSLLFDLRQRKETSFASKIC